jgi:hypothetical protein
MGGLLGKVFHPVKVIAKDTGISNLIKNPSWKSLRDIGEQAAVTAGNYYLPGSSLVTTQLASKGAQRNLNSGVGMALNAASGLSGAGVGQSITNIPSAADAGYGWSNILSGAGNAINNAANGAGITLPSGVQSALTGSSALTSTPQSTSIPSSLSGTGKAAESGGGLFSGIFGGGASSYAPAIGGAVSYLANKKALNDLTSAGAQGQAYLNPYLQSGQQANDALSTQLGLNGNTSAAGYGSLTKPFSASDFTADPGYQFRLEQGQKELDRQQAARGGFFSGGAIKEGQDFSQGLADQAYNDAYNRYTQNQNNAYQKLAGQAGVGLNAADQSASLAGNIGSAKANSTVSGANTFNSLLASLLAGNNNPYLLNRKV